MGGTNSGDYGTFNVTSTSTAKGFDWYAGTLKVGVYSGGGAGNGNASLLNVNVNITIRANGSQAMAWAGGTPNSPYSYTVMEATGQGNTITDASNSHPAPTGWTGSVVSGWI